MSKKTKATLSIAILGCIIGALMGRFIVNYYFGTSKITIEQQILDNNKPTAESLGMILEDKKTILDSELESELQQIQEEMNNTTSDYIAEQEAEKNAALKAEEEVKKAEEAKKKTEEAAKQAKEEKKELENEKTNSENIPSEGDEIPTPEVENGEADDYTEENYVPGTPDPDFVDPYAGDPNVISGTLDFGDPSQHVNQGIEDYVPQQDMSGWEF